MAVCFADYSAVLSAYDAVINKEIDWLALAYDRSLQPEGFYLFATGANGLSGLGTALSDLSQVYIALYRAGDSDDSVIVNIIPATVSGVRRARALVHSRRIGAVFQAHKTTLTVDHLSNLTPNSILQALASPDAIHIINSDRATDEMGQYATPLQPSNEPLPNSPGKSSMFSSLLRRKKKLGSEALTIEPFDINQTSFDTSTHLSEEGQPPLPPPKDRFGKHSVSSSPAPLNPQRSLPQSHTTRNRSNSEYTMISRPPSISSEDMVVIRPEHVPRSPAMKMRSLTLPSKWAKDNLDPTERARQRAESRRQRELEEQQAAEDDAQRLLQAKLAKEEQHRQEQLEEEARRVSLEKELKRAALQRKKREERERLEEEENRKQLEARKHADRLRRIEEHRRLESWRREQEAQVVASARLAEQERKKEEEERRNRIRLAGAKVRSAQADVELLTGWVTMQMGPTLVWRRRYFSFVGSTVFFYRSPKEKDANQVIDQVNLRGQIRAVREWNEGYEDLKAIPFSFAVEFVGDDQPWSLFSDTEEEKYKLLGLLTAANGTSV